MYKILQCCICLFSEFWVFILCSIYLFRKCFLGSRKKEEEGNGPNGYDIILSNVTIDITFLTTKK